RCLEQLLDTIPSPVFYRDLAGTYRGCNRAFSEQILGLPRERIVGRSIHEFLEVIPGELARVYDRAELDPLGDGNAQVGEAEIGCADGVRRHFLFNKAIYRDEDGNPAGRVGVMLNITKRKKTERALAESEETYRSIFSSANDAIFVHDGETGEILDVNEKTCELFGCSVEELRSLRVVELSSGEHPFTQEEAGRKVRAAAAGEPQIFEWRSKRKDGRLFWTEVSLKSATIRGKPRVLALVRDITERKRAEETLRENESRLRAITDSAKDAILMMDNEGRVAFWNPAAEAIFGYSDAEAVGRNLHELLAPERYLEAHGAAFPEFRRSGRGTAVGKTLELSAIRKDGAEIDISLSLAAVPIGGNWHAVGVVRDITERKRAEEEVRKLKTLVDHANFGIAISDMNGNLIYINDCLASAHGFSAGELIGRNLRVFHTDEQLPRMKELNDRLRESGEYSMEEALHVHRDGRVFPMLMNGVLIRDKEWNPLFFGATAIDISDWRKAEREHARSQRLLQEFMDRSPISFWAKDLDGRFTLANRGVAALFGCPQEEITGKTNADLLPDQPRVVEELRLRDLEVLRTGRASRFELKLMVGDKPRFFLMSKFPLRDGEGRISGIGGLATDITEQRALEMRLRQSQKMEAIGTLAGGVAHDFNNIIYSIIGFADLAMDHTEEGSKPFRCLEQVREAGRRASDLVGQILAFGRREEIERRPLRLQQVIGEALGMIEGARPRSVEIRERLDPECGEVVADSTEIHQVVLNLCTNAFHAMRERGGVIEVRLEEWEIDEKAALMMPDLKPGRYARLSVNDTGHGMDDSTMRRVFEPYFTTKSVGEGTGLGLFTVHGIVRGLSGDILVESGPGRGTCFDVYLPLRAEDGAPGNAPMIDRGNETAAGNEKEAVHGTDSHRG
ncbi:MAG: PAS domain S-box protein, partial [Candidatus Eisenbacteria bacterium]